MEVVVAGVDREDQSQVEQDGAQVEDVAKEQEDD